MELEIEPELDSDTIVLTFPEESELQSEQQVVRESIDFWAKQFKVKSQCKDYRLDKE